MKAKLNQTVGVAGKNICFWSLFVWKVAKEGEEAWHTHQHENLPNNPMWAVPYGIRHQARTQLADVPDLEVVVHLWGEFLDTLNSPFWDTQGSMNQIEKSVHNGAYAMFAFLNREYGPGG